MHMVFYLILKSGKTTIGMDLKNNVHPSVVNASTVTFMSSMLGVDLKVYFILQCGLFTYVSGICR